MSIQKTTTLVLSSKTDKALFLGAKALVVGKRTANAALDQAVLVANDLDGATSVKVVNVIGLGVQVGLKKADKGMDWLTGKLTDILNGSDENKAEGTVSWKEILDAAEGK